MKKFYRIVGAFPNANARDAFVSWLDIQAGAQRETISYLRVPSSVNYQIDLLLSKAVRSVDGVLVDCGPSKLDICDRPEFINKPLVEIFVKGNNG